MIAWILAVFGTIATVFGTIATVGILSTIVYALAKNKIKSGEAFVMTLMLLAMALMLLAMVLPMAIAGWQAVLA